MTVEKRYQQSKDLKDCIYIQLEEMNNYIAGVGPIYGETEKLKNIGRRLLSYGKPQATINNWEKVVVKSIPEVQENIRKSKWNLCTPALVTAFEMGLLDDVNYNEIKNGGMQMIEKYSQTSSSIKSIYDTIILLHEPQSYVVVKNNDNFDKIVAEKKSKFEQEYLEFVAAEKRMKPVLD